MGQLIIAVTNFPPRQVADSMWEVLVLGVVQDNNEVVVVGLKHFLASKGAENPSEQWEEANDLKMPETIVNTILMSVGAKSLFLSRFEAILTSFFV